MGGDTSTQLSVEHFTSAADFLLALQPERWVDRQQWKTPWVFRGQLRSEWPLLPSAWRPTDALMTKLVRSAVDTVDPLCLTPCFPATSPISAETSNRLRIALATAAIEQKICREFADLANSAGQYVRRIPGELPLIRLLEQGPPMRLTGVSAPDALTAMAQHHGMPTSLLDWSGSGQVAAYFAAAAVPEASSVADERLAVWAINRTRIGANFKEVPVHRSELPYLHAQHGTLTYFSDGDDFGHAHFAEKGVWPDIATYAQPGAIKKLTLAHSEAGELLRLLWLRGVSKVHLMPILDNVSETLKLQWKWSGIT